MSKHIVFLDKALGLLGHPFEIVLLAQRQFMLAHTDRGFLTTFFTLHIDIHVIARRVGDPTKQSPVCWLDEIASSLTIVRSSQ